MNADWPTGAGSLGAHPELARILELVRGTVRDLARKKGLMVGTSDPSDLAQSVVVELLQHKDRLAYRGEQSTKALVREVLVRLVAHRLRAARTGRRDRRRETPLPTGDESSPATPQPATRKGTGPASVAQNRELIDLALQQRGLLSPQEHDVLQRREAGQSHRAIAAALGITEAYSQRLLSDAKKKLRR